jgi:hypothetical protein
VPDSFFIQSKAQTIILGLEALAALLAIWGCLVIWW